MASDIRAIVGQVVATLRTIGGTGYVHTLSDAADRVQVGIPGQEASRLPGVWVALDALQSSHGPQLGDFERTLTVQIEGRAPATVDTTEERTYIAADLLDDICKALEADRSLGSRVNDLMLTGVAIDGDEIGIPGVAIAMAQLTVTWWASSGEGV